MPIPASSSPGSIAHVAPVLDPATRTAQIEVEIDNAQFRLKPGMYAKVSFTVEHKEQRRWSCRPTRSSTSAARRASSCPAKATSPSSSRSTLGMSDADQVEVTSGLDGRRRASSRPARRRCAKAIGSCCSARAPARPAAATARGGAGGAAAVGRRPNAAAPGGGGGRATRQPLPTRALAIAATARSDRRVSGARMSIPRFAIQRPVMMMMLSSIVILLGGISLTRLPVDLLPDISQPTVNVRVNYTGVGPLEMEELVTRPLEQQLSAVAGPRADELDVANEGNSQHPAELRLGHRPQRGDGRHPHAHRSRARPPARGRRSAGDPEVRLQRAADHGPRASRAPTARSIA